MAFDPRPLFDALESKLQASGYGDARAAEPTDPPTGPLAVVMFAGARITEVHGTTGSGLVSFIVRFYLDALAEPQPDTEYQMATWTLQVMDDIAGNFGLGVTSVRNVLPLMNNEAGFQTVGDVMYRLSDLRIDVLVNDLVTYAQ